MRTEDESGIGVVRRTHDMGLLRPHPDFDERLIPGGQRAAHNAPGNTTFSLAVEFDAAAVIANDASEGGGGDSVVPAPANPRPELTGLNMSMLRTRLFERPQAELHSNYRGLDRDSYFRYKDAARLANQTTNHSNVFLVRLTTSYFVVDPRTGAIGEEYIDSTGEPIRARAKYVVDRTIPVGFLPGKPLNTLDTVIYSEVGQ